MKKILSCLLSAAVAYSGSALPVGYAAHAFAADPAPPPQLPQVSAADARAFFESRRVFKDEGGRPDNLRTYLFDAQGQITPMGQALYGMLQSERRVAAGGVALPPESAAPASASAVSAAPSASVPGQPVAGQPVPGQAVPGQPAASQPAPGSAPPISPRLEEMFNGLRRLGPATPERLAAANAAITQTGATFFNDGIRRIADENRGNNAEMPLSALFQQGFDGASGAGAPPADFVQVNTSSGVLLIDGAGVAIILEKFWYCRHSSWPSSQEPRVMSQTQFNDFKTRHGDNFNSWNCGEGTKEDGILWHRELLDKQKEMNRNLPPGAPRVPETGKYNYETVAVGMHRVTNDLKNHELAYIQARMTRLNQLLGNKFTPDQLVKDGKYNQIVLDLLEKEAREMKVDAVDAVCRDTVAQMNRIFPGASETMGVSSEGRITNYLDLVNCAFAKHRIILNEAKKNLAAYQTRVEGYRGRELISQSEINQIQNAEKLVSKFLLMSFGASLQMTALGSMEQLNRQFDHTTGRVVQAEAPVISWSDWHLRWPIFNRRNDEGFWSGLSPIGWGNPAMRQLENPDARMARENLEALPQSEEFKRLFASRGGDIADRSGRGYALLLRLEQELAQADFLTGMGRIQGILGTLQTEMNEVALDASLYSVAPAMAKAANEEAGNSWLLGKLGLEVPKLVPAATRFFAGLADDLGLSGVTEVVTAIPSMIGHPLDTWNSLTSGQGIPSNYGWSPKQYLEDRKFVDKLVPALNDVMTFMAGGNFDGARARMMAIDPDALARNWSVGVTAGDSLPTNQMKLMAVTQQAEKALGRITQTHMVTGTAINLAAWSVGLGFLGPIASGILSTVGKTVSSISRGITAVGQGLAAVKTSSTLLNIVVRPVMWTVGLPIRVMGFALKVAGAIMENAAARIASLTPARDRMVGKWATTRYMTNSVVRGFNASFRIGGFTMLAGGLGSVMSVAMHLGNEAGWVGTGIPSGRTWHAVGWDAFWQGAKWSTDSWHPMILFAGLSTNAFSNMGKFTTFTESLAGRGVVGNLLAGIKTTWSGVTTAASWTAGMAARGSRFFGLGGAAAKTAPSLVAAAPASQAGIFARIGASSFGQGVGAAARGIGGAGLKVWNWAPVQMADHIAKFMVVSHGAGYIAEQISLARGLDGEHIERGIKRAQQAKAHAAEAPWWLLLPVGSAANEQAAHEAARTRQGIQDYFEAGMGHKLMKAVDTDVFPMLKKPKVSVMELLFNMRWRGEVGDRGVFTVPENVRRGVVERYVKEYVEGKGSSGKPALETYLDIINGDLTHVGGFKVDQAIRDAAEELFAVRVVKQDLALAIKYLEAKTGDLVGESGIASMRKKLTIAREILKSEGRGNPTAAKLSEELLGANNRSEIEVQAAMAKLVEELANVSGKKGKEFEILKNHMEDWYRKSDQWDRTKDTPTPSERPLSWEKQFEFIAAEARRLKIDGPDLLAIDHALNGLRKVQERLNANNNVAHATNYGDMLVQGMLTELGSRKIKGTVQRDIYTKTLEAIAEIRSAHKGTDAVNGIWKTKVLEPLRERINLAKENKLDAVEVNMLERFYEDVSGAPAVVRDQKGTNLLSLRDGQVRALTNVYLSSIGRTEGTAAMVREFMLAETGIGKTLIAFEGLLPFVQAHAAVTGRKIIFLTVSEKLLTQAKADYRMMNRTSAKLHFDTYEGFKSRLANGEKVSEWYLLADEMDGAALQAALTLGQEAGTITYEARGYRKLREDGDHLLHRLDRGPEKLTAELESAREGLLKAADGLPPGAQATKDIGAAVAKLESLTQALGQLYRRSFSWLTDRGQLLSQAGSAMRTMVGEIAPHRARLAREVADDLAVRIAKLEAEAAALKASGKAPSIEAQAHLAKLQELSTLVAEVRRPVTRAEVEALVPGRKNPVDLAREMRNIERARLDRLEAKAAELRSAGNPTLADALTASAQRLRRLAELPEQFNKAETRAVGLKTLAEEISALRAQGKTKLAEALELQAARMNKFSEVLKEAEAAATLRTKAASLDAQIQAIQSKIADADLNPTVSSLAMDKAQRANAHAEMAKLKRELEAVNKELRPAEAAEAKAMEGLNAELGEIWLAGHLRDISEAARKIETNLASQEALLSGMPAEAAALYRNALQEFRQVMSRREGLAMANRSSFLEKLHEVAEHQTAVFGQSDTGHGALARSQYMEAVKSVFTGRWGSTRKLFAQARETANIGKNARAELLSLTARMKAEAKAARPGWEMRVRELIKQREQHLANAVKKENAAWQTWKEMLDSMHLHAKAQAATRAPFENLEMAPARAKDYLVDQIVNLRNNSRAMIEKLEAEISTLRAKGESPAQAEAQLALARKAQADMEIRVEALTKRAAEIDFGAAGSRGEAGEVKLVREIGEHKTLLAELKTERAQLLKDLAAESEAGAQIRIRERLDGIAGRTKELEARLQRKEIELSVEKMAETIPAGEKTPLWKSADAREIELRRTVYEGHERLRELRAEQEALRAQIEKTPPEGHAAIEERMQRVVSEAQGLDKSMTSRLAEMKGVEDRATALAMKNLSALADDAANWAASMFNKHSILGTNPAAAELATSIRSPQTGWKSHKMRLQITHEKAMSILHRRVEGLPWYKLAWRIATFQPINRGTVGLSRYYSYRLIKDILNDPFMPPAKRWEVFWDIVPGMFFTRIGSQRSYVLTELYNLATAYHDNPRGFRYDGISGRIVPVHNGEWSPTMDVPTKRAHEIWNKADLTLKYGEGKLETYVSIVGNPEAMFFGFSGTEGAALKRFHGEHKVQRTGEPPAGMKNIEKKITGGRGDSLVEMKDGGKQIIERDIMRLGETDIVGEAAAKTKAHLPGQADGLLVLALPDTIGIRQANNFMLKATYEFAPGRITPEVAGRLREYGYSVTQTATGWTVRFTNKQMVRIFSGSEVLRATRPRANVSAMENTKAMESGTAKIVFGDSRIFSRGVDLPFKGKGRNSETGFRGYAKYEMQHHGPNGSSPQAQTQVFGRIADGRTGIQGPTTTTGGPQAVQKRGVVVIEVQSAYRDVFFQEMVANEPVMRNLSTSRRAYELAREHGKLYPDWIEIHQVVVELEAAGRLKGLTGRYREVVNEYLGLQMGEVAELELLSSQVNKQGGKTDRLRIHLSPRPIGLPRPR